MPSLQVVVPDATFRSNLRFPALAVTKKIIRDRVCDVINVAVLCVFADV